MLSQGHIMKHLIKKTQLLLSQVEVGRKQLKEKKMGC